MGKKYLVIAGRLPKRNRNELRGSFVSSDQLIQLYKVNRSDCEIYTGAFLPSEMQGLIALEPDPTGLYVLPTQKIGEAEKEITRAPIPQQGIALQFQSSQNVSVHGHVVFCAELGLSFSLGGAGVAAATYLDENDVLRVAVAYAPKDIEINTAYFVNTQGQFTKVLRDDLGEFKAYEMDDEQTIYAARYADEAKAAYLLDMGGDFEIDAEYPLELTNVQLDHEFPDFDEHEVLNGKTFTIRSMLKDKTEAGYLCGGAQ